MKGILFFCTILLMLSTTSVFVSCADNSPAPQKVRLKDGEKCNQTKCDCGHVEINKGCECQITETGDGVGNGIGVNCPPPTVPTGVIVGIGVAILILLGYFWRRRRK